uniref:Uncharacterized protein n=1 Tax=Megaselia scalaris TaxID=36166 RepID=T1GGN8_MEGSC
MVSFICTILLVIFWSSSIKKLLEDSNMTYKGTFKIRDPNINSRNSVTPWQTVNERLNIFGMTTYCKFKDKAEYSIPGKLSDR